MNRKTLEIVLYAAGVVGLLCILVVGFLYFQQNRKNKYMNAQHNFVLKYPDGWSYEDGKNNTAVMFFAPASGELDAFRDNFSVVVQDLSRDPMSLKQYTDQAIMQAKVVFKEQIDVVESVSAKVDGNPGYRFVFIGKSNIFDLKLMIVWTIKGYNAYQFTFTSTAAEFDAYLPQVEAMIASIKLP